jgi:hypothetical protein
VGASRAPKAPRDGVRVWGDIWGDTVGYMFTPKFSGKRAMPSSQKILNFSYGNCAFWWILGKLESCIG